MALRALRHVIGELRLAGMIPAGEKPALGFEVLHLALGQVDLVPSPRPVDVSRPELGRIDFQSNEVNWLDRVKDDLLPITIDGQLILAELCKFSQRDFRRELDIERARAPFALASGDDSDDWMRVVPQAFWLDHVVPVTDEPSPVIVRRLDRIRLLDVPPQMLVICPYWLRRLSWRSHPHRRFTYLDATGQRVAWTVWWRDGVRHDVQERAFWAEGVVLAITAEGRAQIEAITGPLKIAARATRTFKDDRQSPLIRRGAEKIFS